MDEQIGYDMSYDQVERKTRQEMEGCLDDASWTPKGQGYGASLG